MAEVDMQQLLWPQQKRENSSRFDEEDPSEKVQKSAIDEKKHKSKSIGNA